MGEQEDWVQAVGFNGLRPDEHTDSIFRVLDERRWMIAEERAAELIACIKPTEVSEQRRLAVADYVRKLIMQCFPCQVFTFGSVPLKTYLPDGDIDLTTFSWTLDSNDSWANDVRNMLESEEKNENAEFQVQEVQFIQAEVKIVKCLVENIVVDISFNQIGGLCTLCFLEEVDQIIGHNHLFKRSIILIKAWCYYESRILGAHHGLISTYALETLVLYIFHVFNETFKGPLEVLYRFLEFFSKFDWENFCVSLWGPVPLSSLPEVIAEPPRKDSKQLLLKNDALENYLLAYGYNPYQEHNGAHFPKKSFNVVDPLRLNNNLGRSVSKGNFFRIRSAFAFGSMKLARLIDCPEENLYSEVNQFFSNTWQRHGNRIRPDAPCKAPKCMRPSSPDSSKCKVEERQESNSVETENASTVHHDHNNARKSHARQGSSGTSSLNHSSPEVADVASEPASRSKPTDKKISNTGITRCNSMNRNAVLSEVEGHLNTGLPSDRRTISCSASYATDSEVSSSSYQNNYFDDHTCRHFSKEHFSEDEQDRRKMMISSMLRGFNGQFHLPLNIPSGHLPFAPSMLASFSSGQKNVEGRFQGDVPSIENSWAMNMQFPAVPPEMVHYFHSNCMPEMSQRMNVGLSPTDGSSLDSENKVWDDPDQNCYENEAEETVNSVTGARNSTLKSGSSGCSAGVVLSIAKERQGIKPDQSGMFSSAYESAQIVTDHASVHPDDDVYGKDGKTIANRNTFVRSELQPIHTHIGQNHRPHGVELPLLNGMKLEFDLVSGKIATDKPGVPLRFIPAGPPVPFLAWLNNVPNGSRSEEDLRRSDTFDSNLIAHWHILMYARSCQRLQNNLRLGYPSQFTHPPAYGIPPGGSVRPPAANMNPYTPFTGGDAHYIPVSDPVTSMPNQPSTDYQLCLEELPRHRGTGTYLPNPKINAENRRVPGNRRVNYGYDRNYPQSDKAGNWNHNKPQQAGRNRIQTQYEKGGPKIHRYAAGESRNEKSGGASCRRPGSEFIYQSQVDSLHSPASTWSGSTDVAYDTYSMPACSVKGGSQSLMMMYPYGQKVGYSPYPQVLEFGSLGPIELPGKEEYSFAKYATRSTCVPENLHLTFNR